MSVETIPSSLNELGKRISGRHVPKVQEHYMTNVIAWTVLYFISVAIPAAIYRSAQGPGLESAPKSAFGVILGIWLRVPQRVLGGVFFCHFGPLKVAKSTPRRTLWNTPSQVPKITQKALFEALSSPDH